MLPRPSLRTVNFTVLDRGATIYRPIIVRDPSIIRENLRRGSGNSEGTKQVLHTLLRTALPPCLILKNSNALEELCSILTITRTRKK